MGVGFLRTTGTLLPGRVGGGEKGFVIHMMGLWHGMFSVGSLIRGGRVITTGSSEFSASISAFSSLCVISRRFLPAYFGKDVQSQG